MAKSLTVLIFVFLSCVVSAQLHLPPMEISIKAGVANFDMKTITVTPPVNLRIDTLYSYWAPNWQCEMRWNLSQYVSLGASASLGSADFKATDGASGNTERLKGGH